jgi:hypothetical protein
MFGHNIQKCIFRIAHSIENTKTTNPRHQPTSPQNQRNQYNTNSKATKTIKSTSYIEGNWLLQ